MLVKVFHDNTRHQEDMKEVHGMVSFSRSLSSWDYKLYTLPHVREYSISSEAEKILEMDLKRNG